MIRALGRLGRLALHLLHALGVVLVEFPRAGAAARRQRIAWWSQGVLRCLGIRLQIVGTPAAAAKLLVANHVSWLDVIAIHAVCPEARFVSKADVAGWPLLGRLVDAGDTLYLRRESKRAAMHLVADVAAALRGGATVAVFPEGTTSAGDRVLPFHANLLQAAITAGVPVQPLALGYADAAGTCSAAVAYVDEVTLLQSAWRVASARGLTVRLQWLASVPAGATSRRVLAGELRSAIQAARGG